MTKSTLNQIEYTEGILQAAGRDASEYSSVIKVWWWNPTNPSSLRLSKFGIQYIKKFTRIPVYECVLPEPLKNRTLVQLSRVFTCPYYIQKSNEVLILGEEEAVLLKLHADNLQQYLDNLEING